MIPLIRKERKNMFFGGRSNKNDAYEYYSSETDDSDEEFEDALEIARRTRREMMHNRAQFEQRMHPQQEEEKEFNSNDGRRLGDEEEEREAMMMEKRGAKLKSWAGAFSAFDEEEDEDGVRKHFPKLPPFPLPREFARPEFLREERRVDFGADELEYDDKGHDDSDDDERVRSHGKAATRSGGRFRAATTPMSSMLSMRASPSSSSKKNASSSLLVESLASQLRACELRAADALEDAERESEQAARCERENEKLREKLKRMEESVKELQKVCALDRRKRAEGEERAAEAKAKEERMKLDVREAITLLREREREIEEFGKMAKEAERKKNEAREHALTMRANSRKLERENARLRTAAAEMEGRMEQIVSMNEQSGRSISEIVRSSPMKRHPQLAADRREEEDKEEEEETKRATTETHATAKTTPNIAAGTRTDAIRLQSPSWSWFRDATEDALTVSKTPVVSRRNGSAKNENKTDATKAPPYATSADLRANNLLLISQNEKNITLLSSERDHLLQLLATKFSTGAGKSMKERERKLAVEDRLNQVEMSLKQAKLKTKTLREE